jgi:RNA polymerase sigma factor (sigma-70 family)
MPHLKDQLEEVIQSLFCHLAHSKAVERFDKNYGVLFSTWMCRVIYNHLYLFVTKKKEKREFERCISLQELYNPHSDHSFSLESITLDKTDKYSNIEIKNDLKSIGRKIANSKTLTSINRRRIISLIDYYSRGYTDKEIAQELEMTIANVGINKRMLRNILEEEGIHG